MARGSVGSWRYLYERLGEKRFQQLCNALLALAFPDVRCFPVGQKDGGRDAARPNQGRSLIYQVKWTSARLQDPVAWLDKAIRGETANIERLVSEGAGAYCLLTCVAGTAERGRGTIDRLDERLEAYSETFGIPMDCWWQSDIDARVDAAPRELKWAYAEMLAGQDLIRYLIEADVRETRGSELDTLLRKVIATQWQEDSKVKFRQVEMDTHNLADLFIDVHAHHVVSPRALGYKSPSEPEELDGAAQYLLQFRFPFTLVRGAPGQGKSTLGQYLCQVHRAEFLKKDGYLGGPRPELATSEPRLPLRVDLRDYALWMDGGDPFADSDAEPPRRRRPSPYSVEAFLAYLLHRRSGGLPATVSVVHDIIGRFPMLIVLDGLDEVPQGTSRDRVVREINEFTGRLGSTAATPQVVVTTRPNASGLPEPAETFEIIVLTDLSPALRKAYLRKWADAHSIHGPDRRRLQRIFDERTAEPHIAQLADNPMQLTILLYLIHRRQDAVPRRRTELYTSYMETLLDREQAKTPAVREYREDLEELTAFLGWHLQATAETKAINGRLPKKAIRRAINDYLFQMDKDTSVVDALFGAVTDRLWALTSKVDGTYEFDVPPVREYFAARYLYAFAGADSEHPQKSAVLQHLIRRSHWLNICRFYAGFANPNEISGLVEGLEEEIELGRHPGEVRLAAWPLLVDGVFTARPRTQRRVERLFLDDLSIRLICLETESSSGIRHFAGDKAAVSLAGALRDAVAAEPSAPLNSERLRLAARLVPDRASFDAWWRPYMEVAIGTYYEDAWLRAGISFQGGQRLAADQVSRLKLANPGSAAAALEAGVVPSPGSPTEAQFVRAVLSGLCSEAAAASGYAGDILRLLSPQHFLRKASSGQLTYAFDVGHTEIATTDQQRQLILNRLKSRDPRFSRIQAALRTRRGQARTASMWGNTARQVCQIFGPCWIAAEIAIIGAASPDSSFRTEGDVTPGSSPFGENPDYGRLLQELRFNRSQTAWWKSQFEAHTDPLSRCAWLLGLVTVANESVVIECLDQLASGLRDIPSPQLSALCLSSSRIGASSDLGRPLGTACREKAAAVSSMSWLLAAHHAGDIDGLDALSGPSDRELASLGMHGIAAWPATHALTLRMLQDPTADLLACLRRHGSGAAPQNGFSCDEIPIPLLREVVAKPGEFPLGWVLRAERALAASVKEPSLADIADQEDWFT